MRPGELVLLLKLNLFITMTVWRKHVRWLTGRERFIYFLFFNGGVLN